MENGSIHEKDLYEKLMKLEPEHLIKTVFEIFKDKAAISTSFQKNGVVIIDMAKKVCDLFRVYFIDTLLNPPETYQFIKEIEKKYDIKVEIYKPVNDEVENLKKKHGQYPYLFSESERQYCCKIRKVNPAKKVEKHLDAVINGLRKDQSVFRAARFKKINIEKKEDGSRLFKISPLFNWSEEKLDRYIEENNIPVHPLYSYESEYGERYRVIGCKCCHFPIQDWRKKRAGKFPWEKGKKECGIHFTGGEGI